jgi:hypothetical protein
VPLASKKAKVNRNARVNVVWAAVRAAPRVFHKFPRASALDPTHTDP